jgi:hypothetical protein
LEILEADYERGITFIGRAEDPVARGEFLGLFQVGLKLGEWEDAQLDAVTIHPLVPVHCVQNAAPELKRSSSTLS